MIFSNNDFHNGLSEFKSRKKNYEKIFFRNIGFHIDFVFICFLYTAKYCRKNSAYTNTNYRVADIINTDAIIKSDSYSFSSPNCPRYNSSAIFSNNSFATYSDKWLHKAGC